MTSTFVPRPPILDAIPVPGATVVEASAGTGKTYLLQHLVADLVVGRGIPLERILVVTFTEKAAAELRQRIRTTLRDILECRSEQPTPTGAFTVDDVARSRARDALSAFGRAHIGTIHQFCHDTMRELGVLAAEPPARLHEIVDEPHEEAWRRVVRRRLLDPAFARFWARVSTTERRQLARGVRVITTTRAPAEPSLDALRAEVGALRAAFVDAGRPRQAETATEPFHATGWKWTRMKTRKRTHYLAWLRALTDVLARDDGEADPLDFLMERLGPIAADLLEAKEIPGEALASATAFADPAHRTLVERAVAVVGNARLAPLVLLGEDVATTMRRLHDERDTITFNEMIWRLRDALAREVTARGGPGPLVRALRDRYAVALIDEFQDTDEAQWDIFRTVFLGANDAERAAPTPPATLVLVGDPKQAIYRFRGADLHAYQAAVRAVTAHPAGAEVPLDENHRSGRALLAAVHAIQAGRLFPADEGITLAAPLARRATHLVDPLDPRPVTQLGVPYDAADDTHGEDDDDDEDEDGGENGSDAQDAATRGSIDAALAEAIALEIGRLLDPRSGVTLVEDEAHAPRALHAGDIAVLARTHTESAIVADALAAHGVPFLHYKRRGLFVTAEALDLKDVLEAVVDPSDRAATARALATAFFPVGGARLDDVLGASAEHPARALLERAHRRARRGDVPGALRVLEHESGVIERLLAAYGERAAANMSQLLELCFERASARGVDLAVLLEELKVDTQRAVDEQSEVDLLRLESERDRVRVLTMHTAKGLEFPVVFLFGGYRGRARSLPSDPVVVHDDGKTILALNPDAVKKQWVAEENSEDARVLYVAMTRAKAKLYLPSWTDVNVKGIFRAGIYARIEGALTDPEANGLEAHVSRRRPPRRARAVERAPGVLSDDERRAITALSPPAPTRRDGFASRVIARARRGPGLSSFTRLSHEVAAQPREPHPDALSADAGRVERIPDEVLVDAADPSPDVVIPGGTLTGSVFHAVLETLDGDAVRDARDFDAWFAHAGPEVTLPFRRLGFDDDQCRASARLVFHTWRRPLAPFLPALRFAHVEERLAELDFRVDPRVASTTGPGPAGGLLGGSVDLVCRHEGKVYLVDWKTNVIPHATDPARVDYGAAAVRALTEEKYGLQIEIYTVAAVRWLGLHDEAAYERAFGGVLYVYLRGFGDPRAPDGDGLYFHRPSFAEVSKWAARLASLDEAPPRPAEDEAAWRAS